MANSQTHAMQLPHAYLFAHYARGGRENGVDLRGFAERLIAGAGDKIARGWEAIGAGDPGAQRVAAEALRPLVGRAHRTGDCVGLLFDDPDRFLADLIHSLEIHAALTEFQSAAEGGPAAGRPALRALVPRVRAQLVRTGFNDAYCDDRLEVSLNRVLKRFNDPRINEALTNFRNWSDPVKHHGAISKLLDVLEVYAAAEKT